MSPDSVKQSLPVGHNILSIVFIGRSASFLVVAAPTRTERVVTRPSLALQHARFIIGAACRLADNDDGQEYSKSSFCGFCGRLCFSREFT